MTTGAIRTPYPLNQITKPENLTLW